MDSTSFEFINPRYLSTVNDEPKQLLQPISGYTREPILPLEEACVSLIPIVPRLQAHVWIAKKNSKKPADGLTQDESAAIRLYTMEWDAGADEPRSSLYSQLNRTLKQVDRTKLRPWFRYLKLFLTALAKLPSAPRQTVWRGVRKDHTADYPPGEEATWWAFSSCTSSLNVLQSDLYLGSVGTRTLFSIETINGRNIQAHSHFQVEDEILLLPGTHFEVKSRLNPAPDLYIIHLTQKRPLHDLLDPPFEGAELFPTSEPSQNPVHFQLIECFEPEIRSDKPALPWYKKNKLRLAALALLVAIIVVAVVLGVVLSYQAKRQAFTASTISGNCVVEYSQCGGIEWSGSTRCCINSTCTFRNSSYLECLPMLNASISSSSAVAKTKVITNQTSQIGVTGRYWDCCKVSCGWPDKAFVTNPVRTCARDGNTTVDSNIQSICSNGDAYMCNNQQPWSVNDSLSYGFAGANIINQTEADSCCTCYSLVFTSAPVIGKEMIVQVTNSLYEHTNYFTLQIPGGGSGSYSSGCKSQFSAQYSWGQVYGGISKRSDCAHLPSVIQGGCYWRFDWFMNADNPTVVFEQVTCPSVLVANTLCSRM